MKDADVVCIRMEVRRSQQLGKFYWCDGHSRSIVSTGEWQMPFTASVLCVMLYIHECCLHNYTHTHMGWWGWLHFTVCRQPHIATHAEALLEVLFLRYRCMQTALEYSDMSSVRLSRGSVESLTGIRSPITPYSHFL